MNSIKSLSFAEEPEAHIRHSVSQFVKENAANRRGVDGGNYFGEPLIGYASAADPLFVRIKEMIGDFLFSPRGIFEATFGKSDPAPDLYIISWVLPISDDVRKANSKEGKFPALLWSHTRFFGEPFNDELRKHVVSLLQEKGYRAVAPAISPLFIHHTREPRVGLTSNWSERHTAYVCGLGTFGLCDGLITPKGKAMRLGSVVTDLPLAPSRRHYSDHHAHCLFYAKGTCKACMARCPAGAISPDGHDKDKCFDYMHNVSAPAKGAEYGVKITGCGLCQTKVPCEFEIPKALQSK
jgi:ferredoxin